MISPQRALSDVSPSSALLLTEFRTQFNSSEIALTKTTLLDSLGSNNFASPNTFWIGRRVGGGGASVKQDLYAFMLFPFVLSPLQISNLHKKVMRRINTP